MNNLFSIGEVSKYQNISKQTLIFYDKIGLFKPYYINPNNGYRYYSAEQLDYLDTILIMKTIGFSLEEIKHYMKTYNIDNSISLLKNQLNVINKKINELSLIKSRLQHRCEHVEKAFQYKNMEPQITYIEDTYILLHDVHSPYSMSDISIATKKCYAQAFKEQIPIFFQCGVSVPLDHIIEKRYTEATKAFVTTDNMDNIKNITKLPQGLTISMYHFGNYQSIGKVYQQLIDYCKIHNYNIISPSYEFCINDYITSKDENEFITKILFYIR